MKVHLAHLKYLLRRKWLFFRLGSRVGVSLRERLTHDLYQFRPKLWRIGVQVFHVPSGEAWVHARAKEVWRTDPGLNRLTFQEAEHFALEHAKDDHVKWAREQAKLNDVYALLVQHSATYRWEHYIVRDMAETRYTEMPEHCVRTMLADWLTGAIMSGAREDDVVAQVRSWYVRHRSVIRMYPNNRKLLQELLEGLGA